MIKLIVFLFVVALIGVIVYEQVLDSKLEYMDKLVDRGVEPSEACRRVFK